MVNRGRPFQIVAEGEPKLAFACIDGTVARAHQKASGARPTKPIR